MMIGAVKAAGALFSAADGNLARAGLIFFLVRNTLKI
jgi:hypothetical protein